MLLNTIAILSPGEMGSAFGKALSAGGYRIVSTLDGRSEATRQRAQASGFEDVGSLANVVAAADLILSIVPPEHALTQAELTARAMKDAGRMPLYADCNAVAPETAKRIGAIITGAGADFIDGGIIGNPPGGGKQPARLFVSRPKADVLAECDGKGIAVRHCGADIGRASAVKMVYGGITKGTSALHALMLLAAERMGVSDELHQELQASQAAAYKRMENMTSALPAVSNRYVGEMLEIAKALDSVDLPAGVHEGAADLYRLLNQSPFAAERRDTVDKSRTLRQTIEVCARVGMSDIDK